jgi:hypothetical protein
VVGTNYQKVLSIISPELDELYIAIKNIERDTHIFTARGISLDKIGDFLDFYRTGTESDNIYRNKLMNVIDINSIAGTKSSIKKLLINYLTLNESDVQIRETTPNYIIIRLPEEYEPRDMDIRDMLYRSVAAGIYVGVHYTGNYWDEGTWDDSEAGWG